MSITLTKNKVHASCGTCQQKGHSREKKTAISSTIIRATSMFVFFFQAEDGIRDLTVTGVQTCALPIFWPPPEGVITMSSAMWPRCFSLKCCEIVESIHRSVMFSTRRLYSPVYKPRERAYPSAAWSGNRAVLSVVFVGSEIFVPRGVSARTLIVSSASKSIMNGEWVE